MAANVMHENTRDVRDVRMLPKTDAFRRKRMPAAAMPPKTDAFRHSLTRALSPTK